MDSYELKAKMWHRYVNDTFVIWPHWEEEINGFLQHLNALQEAIKFTMQLEVDNKIPFLVDNSPMAHYGRRYIKSRHAQGNTQSLREQRSNGAARLSTWE
ncbi:hypothetical protein Trydic_g13507 [Trypoxylus dichotomus]